eukprot:jgi/Tetstr1/459161/TSEL_004607.t1
MLHSCSWMTIGPPALCGRRSEVGVQHGARRWPRHPAAWRFTPKWSWRSHTLEVICGAARFDADDGYLVGLPEHDWPALHAFRSSTKAFVGLEELPKLDGHYVIAVNVPPGSLGYVHAYLRRGKAEELHEEVDASMCTLISVKPNRRHTHTMHRRAWALIKQCMQHMAGYWLRNCLPSEVGAVAEGVDATVLVEVKRVLDEVSFDPSAYDAGTNPMGVGAQLRGY